MKYFLIFQSEITIYSLFPNGMFLKFSMWDKYTIFFYSLYPHALFLNFLMWDNYISLHSHELFFNFLMWDNYTTFHYFFIAHIYMNYFLIFQCRITMYSLHPYRISLRYGISILYFTFFFLAYIHMDCFLTFQKIAKNHTISSLL